MKLKLKLWVKLVFISIITITLIILYSRYIGTTGLKVNEYSIINNNIPDNFYGLKIVQISDIHYKMTTDKNDLENIVTEINLLKPDIVILTGDLFDKEYNYSKKDYVDLENMLKEINYTIGKYAIKGDNDINNNWDDIITNSDFIDINDNYELIYSNGINPILLVGINTKNSINKTINKINKDIKENYNYSILALHKPDEINKIDYSKYNLILAGHSLNGQIKIPFMGGIIRYNGSKKYYDNYYKLNNTDLYISGGIGTNKFKFRLNNRPSINLFRLRNK